MSVPSSSVPSRVPSNSVPFNKKRYEGLHYNNNLSFDQIIKLDNLLNNLLNNEKCNIFERINVVQRIGSESVYATIWEIDFNLSNKGENIKLAIKIQTDLQKSVDEINLNNFLRQWPDHFLKMFGFIYCEKIDLLVNKQFNGYFMFMELAIGDLAQFLLQNQRRGNGTNQNQNQKEKQLLGFILDVLDSIYILGKNLVYHGDLHIRNVFIRNEQNEQLDKKNVKQNIAVIGDFGESVSIDSITSHTSDIYKFFSSLLEFLNSYFPSTYTNIKSKISKIITTVNRMTPILENNYDKWNEINRDEEGNVIEEDLDKYFDDVVKNTITNLKQILLQ
jgi:hypothetical protein